MMERKRRNGTYCPPDTVQPGEAAPLFNASQNSQPAAPYSAGQVYPYAPQPPMPCSPQPVPPKSKKKHFRFRLHFGMLFRTFLMLSGAAAWIFLILKYIIVPILSMISGNG